MQIGASMATMMRQTSLAMGISATELREHQDRYDRACKRLLSEKEVLGWILHECLDEYRDVSPSEIASSLIDGDPEVGLTPVHADDAAASLVSGLNAEDSSIDEGTIWYDIRFRALIPGTEQLLGMIVNVEAQGDFYPGYPLLKRATYYCGRMISSQYGRVFTNGHYEKLQKVCSIWICPNPPKGFRNTITRFSMAEESLVGAASLNPAEYDLIEMVLACPDGDQQQKGDGLLRLLGTLLASEKSAEERKAIISDEFGIAMSERLSDEVVEMSNVSKGLEEMWYRQGVDRGYLEGKEKGLEEGRETGLEEGRKVGLEEGRKAGFGEGRKVGLEEGRRVGFDEGRQSGFDEGRQSGFDEGRTQERELLQSLAKALSEQGRSDEFAQAVLNPELLARLLEELGLGTQR